MPMIWMNYYDWFACRMGLYLNVCYGMMILHCGYRHSCMVEYGIRIMLYIYVRMYVQEM